MNNSENRQIKTPNQSLPLVDDAVTTHLTVGEIAAKDYRKATVFQKFGIDFCCGGGVTLAEASRTAGISEGELLSALSASESESLIPEPDFAAWELDALADHIVDTHHHYVREVSPILIEFSCKVAGHHGKEHNELIKLEEEVRRTLYELLSHMEREEKVLFPAIRQLAVLERSAAPANKTQLQFIRHAIQKMQLEHAGAGEDLRLFRRLTNNYTLPGSACNSYKFLFEKLSEFEDDLHRHIHLENNILFPRALRLLERPAAS